MKKINVLSVHTALGSGGAEAVMKNIYGALDKDSINMEFVSLRSEDDKEELVADILRNEGAKIHYIPRLTKKNIVKYRKIWDAFLATHEYFDVIHIQFYNMAPFIVPVAHKHGMKTIVHSHSTANTRKDVVGRAKRLAPLLIRHYGDARLAASYGAGEYLFGKKIKFEVMNNGIQLAEFKYNKNIGKTKRQEINISENDFVVGTVGRITFPKNPEFIVRLIAELSSRISNFKFLWVGQGNVEDEQKVTTALKNFGIEKYVIRLKNRADVTELMNVMDVFVLPSRYEALGISAIESQANGLATLLSNNVEPDTTLVDEKVIRLSIDNDVRLWVDKILELQLEPRNRDTIVTDKLHAYDVGAVAKFLEKKYCNLATQ